MSARSLWPREAWERNQYVMTAVVFGGLTVLVFATIVFCAAGFVLMPVAAAIMYSRAPSRWVAMPCVWQ